MDMFYGIQKTTLVDYPNVIAATLFTGGCNFRCPWCHNPDLVYPERLKNLVPLDEDDVLGFLARRRNQLEGVCITGGEPTLWGERLLTFLARVKALGYRVKVDTNGSHPEWIEEALKKNVVDFFAMDIKNTFQEYAVTVGLRELDIHLLRRSIECIQQSGKDYLFRTTVLPGMDREIMRDFVLSLGVDLSHYVFQEYREPVRPARNGEERLLVSL